MNEEVTSRIRGTESDTVNGHVPVKQSAFGACVDNAFDDKRITIACISVCL